MKKLLFVVFLAPGLSLVNANLADITRAISNGNADALGQYFDQSVEIAVLDQEDVYTKARAIQVVKDFFNKHKPTSFSQVHQGESKGKDSQYCIGNLTTGTSTFRVYIYMKVTNGKFLVQELRFDKE